MEENDNDAWSVHSVGSSFLYGEDETGQPMLNEFIISSDLDVFDDQIFNRVNDSNEISENLNKLTTSDDFFNEKLFFDLEENFTNNKDHDRNNVTDFVQSNHNYVIQTVLFYKNMLLNI